MASLLYLLDANVLVDADRDYYPINRIPEFWDWLAVMGELGRVKVPQEMYEEVVLPPQRPPDALVAWSIANRDTIVLDEPVVVELVARVTSQGYADDLTDEELEKIGRDPFLIAYALADTHGRRTVVTTEGSKPSRKRANRHLPDVSRDFDVPCINTFTLIQNLDFRTDWRTRP